MNLVRQLSQVFAQAETLYPTAIGAVVPQDRLVRVMECVSHRHKRALMEQPTVNAQQLSQNIVTMEIYKMIVHDVAAKQDKHVAQTEYALPQEPVGMERYITHVL